MLTLLCHLLLIQLYVLTTTNLASIARQTDIRSQYTLALLGTLSISSQTVLILLPQLLYRKAPASLAPHHVLQL